MYANEPVGRACGVGVGSGPGQCSSDTVSVCQLGACTDQTGLCTGGGIIPCSVDSNCPLTETCSGGNGNSEFICGPNGGTIKSVLTQCGVCEALGFGCPNTCSGVPVPPSTPAATCVANILLLGGDGGACTTGLDVPCLTCYNNASTCGTTLCTADCSNLAAGAIDGPNGCQCIDCVTLNCDAAFLTCAGFEQGAPAGTPNPRPSTVGGPPVCEAVPTPPCDN